MEKFVYKCDTIKEYQRLKMAIYKQGIKCKSLTKTNCVITSEQVRIKKTDGITVLKLPEQLDITGTPFYATENVNGKPIIMYDCIDKKACFRLIESAGQVRKQHYTSKNRKYVFSLKEIQHIKNDGIIKKLVTEYIDEVGQKYYL